MFKTSFEFEHAIDSEPKCLTTSSSGHEHRVVCCTDSNLFFEYLIDSTSTICRNYSGYMSFSLKPPPECGTVFITILRIHQDHQPVCQPIL